MPGKKKHDGETDAPKAKRSKSEEDGGKKGEKSSAAACEGDKSKDKSDHDVDWAEKSPLKPNGRGIALAYSIVYVSDMEKSIKWYSDTFGFELNGPVQGGMWAQFKTGTTTLALHKVTGPSPPAPVKEKQPEPGQGKPSLFIPNLDTFHASAVAKGVRVHQPPTVQPWGGKQAAYLDPDNLVVSVVEWNYPMNPNIPQN